MLRGGSLPGAMRRPTLRSGPLAVAAAPDAATTDAATTGATLRGATSMEPDVAPLRPTSAVGVTLEVKGLTRRFGDLVALDRVDLTVEAGQFVVLLGPSGSGKTTLLRLLAGIDKVDEGTITLGGKVLADGRLHLPPERRGLAMVFQDYALWPHLTVLANVAYALRRLRLAAGESDARARAMLERVGLARYADGWPHQLSGGEQQRVALARALVAQPGLLLCDEPLSNLDADLRERLRLEIATLAREAGTTVVYITITHDQTEAFALADRVGVLDHGRLVQAISSWSRANSFRDRTTSWSRTQTWWRSGSRVTSPTLRTSSFSDGLGLERRRSKVRTRASSSRSRSGWTKWSSAPASRPATGSTPDGRGDTSSNGPLQLSLNARQTSRAEGSPSPASSTTRSGALAVTRVASEAAEAPSLVVSRTW